MEGNEIEDALKNSRTPVVKVTRTETTRWGPQVFLEGGGRGRANIGLIGPNGEVDTRGRFAWKGSTEKTVTTTVEFRVWGAMER